MGLKREDPVKSLKNKMTWKETGIAVCCGLVLLLWYNVAYAEIDPNNPQQTCVPFLSLNATNKSMNQRQIFRGLNQRKELIVITSNLKTQKWTAWQSVDGKSMCVVAFGSHFKLLEKAGNDV